MGLVIVVILALYVSLTHLFSTAFYQQVGDELMTQANEYAQMAASGGTMMEQMVCMTSSSPVVILNQHRQVVARSNDIVIEQPNAADKRNIQSVLSGQSSVVHGYNSLFGKTGVTAMTPITRGNSIDGLVEMFRPEAAIDSTFNRIERLLLLAGFGATLLAFGLIVVLSSRIARPLREMARLTQELARGHYGHRQTVMGTDEVAVLGQSINDLADELHRLQTTRKEFLADVAHELRTPLSYIRGYTQVLSEGLAKSTEEQQKYLDIISGESERIERLVNDLFSLAQADEGVLQISREPCRLEDIIQESVTRFERTAEGKDIKLVLSLGQFPEIMVDPGRMSQVMFNLLDNAIRYTNPGGIITIRMVSLKEFLQVSVEDTGIGISKAELPHIWDRLYRVEKSRSRERGGTGLGLAIVKQIVELHGGTVQAQSVEGKGTTIAFRIPLSGGEDDQ